MSLPELPEPIGELRSDEFDGHVFVPSGDEWPFEPLYTADQMRAYALQAVEALTQALATSEPGELTRSQKLRNAGYTRRPSWKTLPSDADDVSEVDSGPISCPGEAAKPATTEHKGPLSKDRIREVFLCHGFTVKEGQTDLKPYVYDAAYALIALVQPATERKGEPVAWRWMPSQEFPMWVYSDDQNRVTEARRFMGDGGVQPLYTSPQVPEGLALVPVEPTPKMIQRVRWLEYTESSLRMSPVDDDMVRSVWSDVIDAARKGCQS